MKKQKNGNTANFYNGNQSADSLVTSSDERGNLSANSSKSTDNKATQYGGEGGGNNEETESDRRNAEESGEIDRPGDQGAVILGSLVCGAVPALIVGFGALCYHTGYQHGGKESRPTIVHGNQHNTRIYNISPSIGSNNSNNSHNQ